MKKEVAHAFEDLQEALRDYEGPGYGHGVEVDYESLETVLRWAEKHGLRPDYQVGDRVKLKRVGARDSEYLWLREGDLGNVYSVHDHHIRVVWDTDPLLEPCPQFFSPRVVERVYE